MPSSRPLPDVLPSHYQPQTDLNDFSPLNEGSPTSSHPRNGHVATHSASLSISSVTSSSFSSAPSIFSDTGDRSLLSMDTFHVPTVPENPEAEDAEANALAAALSWRGDNNALPVFDSVGVGPEVDAYMESIVFQGRPMLLYRSFQNVLACQASMYEELLDRIKVEEDESKDRVSVERDLKSFGWMDSDLNELSPRAKFEKLMEQYSS